MAIFDFRDASLKGDIRWSTCSRLTSLAPPLILSLLLLAITQIILGVIWITSIQSASNNLTFAQVIQPLIIPALSFFNTIPSLHLHVLARSNKPLMAMIFSAVMGCCYLASAVVFLPPCVGGDAGWNVKASSGGSGSAAPQGVGFNGVSGGAGRGYAATECPAGSRKDVWGAMVALQFLSAVGYALHFGMAWKVRRWLKRKERDEREGRVMVVIDEAEKARREEEARQRWREIGDL